jgi:chromosome segregation protein
LKIEFVEMSGFRGFREKLRIDFGSGFTVISGRNGVGKSTICDAIEFALTGEIDKYRVEKAAKESLSDYVWWRGDSAPRTHYVEVGFSRYEGPSFKVKRTRESGANMSASGIEEALYSESKPNRALRQLCRTTIIRDEWIAALSLDLKETERFDLVRTALGAAEDQDYAARAKEISSNAQRQLDRLQRLDQEVRNHLNNALTQLSEARDTAAKAADVATALTTIDDGRENSSGDLFERIAKARSRLSTDRTRLIKIS